MSSAYHPRLHQFAVFVVIWTFLLLIAGALVTSNEAALSVPDWPLSYGTITPPMVGGIRYEHSHRVIAATLGLLTIVLAVWLWRKEERRWVRWVGILAAAGVAAQGILGGLTVRLQLHYGIPVAHACLAQIMFGTVVGIALFTSRWWVGDHPRMEDRGWPSIHTLALLNASVIYLQVVFGAGFRHKDIPLWPHLCGAAAVAASVTWTAGALRRRFEQSREIRLARILLPAIFGTQFLLGIGAWWSHMATAGEPQPMPVMIAFTVTHTVVGALMFACSLVVVLLAYRLVPRGGEVVVRSPQQAALW